MVKVHVIHRNKRKYLKRFDALRDALVKHYKTEVLEITSEKTEEKWFEVVVEDKLVFSQKNGDGEFDTGEKVARIFQAVRIALKRESFVNVASIVLPEDSEDDEETTNG